MTKSPWIIEQERADRTRAIVLFVVAITIIAAVMGLYSIDLAAKSMVPAKVNVQDLRGAARYQATH
jgi:hypothetical protein